MPRHRARRGLVFAVALLAGLCLLLVPGRADAHAELESTEPANATSVAQSPSSLDLHFGEAVEVSLGAVRLYDARGDRVSVGAPRHQGSDDRSVTVPVGRLGEGTYVAAWRVLSVDGHPVQGAFTFTVGAGAAADTEALAHQLLSTSGGSVVVGVAYAADRFLVFLSTVAFVGMSWFLAWWWPDGVGLRRARRWVLASGALALVSVAVSPALQGAYVGGLPLVDAFRWSTFDQVLPTRFGRAWTVRITALVASMIVATAWLRRAARPMAPSRSAPDVEPARPSWSARAAVVAMAAALFVPAAMSGHPGAASSWAWTSVLADSLHFSAVAVWMGGLAALAIVAFPLGEANVVRRLVVRFSTVAFRAVVVIVVTGVYQAWRLIGSVDALTGTVYGRTLLVKVAFFVLILSLANWARTWLRHHLVADEAPGVVRRLRRFVVAEVALGVVVLLVTALLVNAAPVRTSASRQQFAAELALSDVTALVTVDPPRRGPVDVHVYTLSASGQTVDVASVALSLRLPAKDVGPVEVPLSRLAPGHYVSEGFSLPLAGRWQMSLTARTSGIDQYTAETTFEAS